MSIRKHDPFDYRAMVRRWEYDLIISKLKGILPAGRIGELKILDFGCGLCEGACRLSQLGHLVASDVCSRSISHLPDGVEFRIADIHHTDFVPDEFDLLFSSQVLEHLQDLKQAFREMKRIAKEDGYYVFSVPTATWLVLSIPAKILKKLKNVFMRIVSMYTRNAKVTSRNTNGDSVEEAHYTWLRKLCLNGHGCYPQFITCFRAFEVKTWRKVLLSNGFEIITEMPLLTYADSDIPIIPPNRLLARLGLASSYLFVCKSVSRQ